MDLMSTGMAMSTSMETIVFHMNMTMSMIMEYRLIAGATMQTLTPGQSLECKISTLAKNCSGGTDIWQFSPRMSDPSLGFGAGTYDSTLGFAMSGGYNSASFEATLDGSSFSTLAPMPIETFMHCLVALDNGGDIFMTGGYSYQGPSNRTYIYRNREGESSFWERQPDMPTTNYGKLIQSQNIIW